MRRAIPILMLTVAGFVVVWRFEPTLAATTSTVAVEAHGEQTVAGTPESMPRGTVQVMAVFSGDRIADVRVLQAPDTGPTRDALPTLRAEALRTQSADIDTVTGATLTSEAYATSLQAALDAKDR